MIKQPEDLFIDKLRAEIIEAQNRRGDLVKNKFSFVIAALGIGSIGIKDVELSLLLYIAPFIALVFDLYILGEDYGLKRAGAFLGRDGSKASEEEIRWENFVCSNRDFFSVFACPLLSLLIVAGAACVLGVKHQLGISAVIWFTLYSLACIFLSFYAYRRNKRIKASANSIKF